MQCSALSLPQMALRRRANILFRRGRRYAVVGVAFQRAGVVLACDMK